MKRSFKSVLAFLALGLVVSAQSVFATTWSSGIVKDVRVVQATNGKRICIIGVPGSVVGFEVTSSADEKMFDVALDALNSKTTFWWASSNSNLTSFTLVGDSAPYYTTVSGVSAVVSTRP